MNVTMPKLPVSLPSDGLRDGGAIPATQPQPASTPSQSPYSSMANSLQNGPQQVGSASAAQAGSAPVAVQGQDLASARELHQTHGINGNRLKKLQDQNQGLASSSQSIESKLQSLSDQYTRLSASLENLPSDASPQQLLKLEQQVNGMSEGIGAFSKLVSQTAAGVKTMLQTQV